MSLSFRHSSTERRLGEAFDFFFNLLICGSNVFDDLQSRLSPTSLCMSGNHKNLESKSTHLYPSKYAKSAIGHNERTWLFFLRQVTATTQQSPSFCHLHLRNVLSRLVQSSCRRWHMREKISYERLRSLPLIWGHVSS